MKKAIIIGREKEIQLLNQVWKSSEAEFIAIYGRRRVGKTYLIRKYFSEKGVYFETSGEKDKPLKKQLENFMKVMSHTFFKGLPLLTPTSWDQAFDLLTDALQATPKSKKIILFFDELPWMATKKSGLLQSIDHYWNLHWSKISNLILIGCGSSASWMLEKLIYAKGGLHKRITRKILLQPFNLKETQNYLESQSIKLTQKQVLDIYMAIGGIPYYLKGLNKGMSAAQNIDAICFEKNGLLYNEFSNLFESLFECAAVNLTIVKEIVKHGNHMSREKLIEKTDIKSGGTLNKRLRELESSGFIQSFLPYGRKQRDRFYRVIDEFSLFHLKWIEPFIHSGFSMDGHHYWQNMVNTPAVSNWAGYAFENICLKHLPQICKRLEITHIPFIVGRWCHLPRKQKEEEGAQIDLLFDRQDGIITLCEIKYSDKPFTIDKAYAKQLIKKMDVFAEQTKPEKQLFLAMITTTGIKENVWSADLVHNEVKLADLFR